MLIKPLDMMVILLYNWIHDASFSSQIVINSLIIRPFLAPGRTTYVLGWTSSPYFILKEESVGQSTMYLHAW